MMEALGKIDQDHIATMMSEASNIGNQAFDLANKPFDQLNGVDSAITNLQENTGNFSFFHYNHFFNR